MDNTPIEGLVAQILNERELVVNMGSQDGVTTGMVFAILGESPLEVLDPVSKEVLGEVDREKVRVEVFEVRERIALCRTYEVVRRVGGLFDSGLSDLIGPRRDIVATLRSDEYAKPLSSKESYVKIGDRARQVKEADLALHTP